MNTLNVELTFGKGMTIFYTLFLYLHKCYDIQRFENVGENVECTLFNSIC